MLWNRRENNGNGSENGSENRVDKKPKSRKPHNTAFRQQRLLAYAPILTPKTVLPIFFAVGIIFGPIGGLLLYASSQVSSGPSSRRTKNHSRCKRSLLTIHIVRNLLSHRTSQISRS